jgi:hypothetical protein
MNIYEHENHDVGDDMNNDIYDDNVEKVIIVMRTMKI